MDPRTLALKVDEAAQQIGISRSMMWKLITQGKIQTFSVGKRRLIAHSELVKFIQQSEAERRELDATVRTAVAN